MEHLLSRGGTPPITITFLANEEWDGEDFLSYPQRQGWDPSIWEWSEDEVRLDTQGLKLDDLAIFLQCWLFFGLLETVLGKRVPASDFTRLVDDGDEQRKVITTEKLTDYLDECKETLTNLSDEEIAEREDVIHDALSEAMIVNYRINRKIYFGDPYPDSDLLQETLLGQTLLFLALGRFVSKVLTTIDWDWVESPQFYPFLEQQMIDAEWCPFDVQFLRLNFPADVMAYVFSLGCTSQSKDHSHCKERYSEVADHCVADSIGMEDLPKHVDPDCHCPLIGPDMDEIEQAIRNGTIPVVALSLPQDETEEVELLLWEEDLTEGKMDMGRYFAISHVWKEGLGNPDTNLLPSCQVRRMANILLELEASEQGKSIIIAGSEALDRRLTVPFWMDTFCIPVRPESQDLRDICISRMRKIYESSTAVIALDPDLQGLDSTASPLVFLGHLMSCSWRSRLWTYQEGNLSWALLVPAHGKVFDVEKVLDPYPELEKHHLDPTDGTAKSLLEASLIRSIVDNIRLLIRSSMASIEVAKHPEAALSSMLRALAHRTTSRAGDETICIATFMNIDPTPLLAEPPKNRMQKLICLLPVLSKAMLFAFGPRLQDLGFRWAPETLLSPHGYRKDFRFPSFYKPDISDAEGLVEISPPYLCPEGRGMVAVFSGMKIERQESKPLPDHFKVMTSVDEGFVIDVNDAGAHEQSLSEVCADPSKEWAILFANEKKIRHIPDALLVEWIRRTEDGRNLCRWTYDVLAQQIDDCVLEGERAETLQQAVYQGRLIPFSEWIID